MSAVTVQEIVEALRQADDCRVLPYFKPLAARIEAHGIAPPDGIAVVKAEQSAKPVRYVPMTDAEFKEWYAKEQKCDRPISIWFYEMELEQEIIKRAIAQGAKLEVKP